MKNISRRVFIKGMAVAAAATAASTVLAGCNVPTGPIEQPEVVPTSQSVTYTDAAGKTLTVVASEMETFKASNLVAISLQVKNNTAQDLYFVGTAPKNSAYGNLGKDCYYVTADRVTVYYDGEENKVAGGIMNAQDSVFTGTKVTNEFLVSASGNEEGKLYIATPDFDEWDKITVVLHIREVVAGSSWDEYVKEVKFTFSK